MSRGSPMRTKIYRNVSPRAKRGVSFLNNEIPRIRCSAAARSE